MNKKFYDNLEKKNNELFELLKIFYNKSTKQQCPSCKGSFGIKKEIDEKGDLIMSCLDKKCDWKVIIKRGKYINLFEYYKKLNKEIKDDIYCLLQTEEINKYKPEIIKKQQKIKEIDKIFQFEEKKIEELEEKRFDLVTKIFDLFYKRKNKFYEIKGTINNKLKLIKIFKNEKNLDEKRIKEISKTFNINFEDLKNYFDWLALSNDYIKIQIQLRNITEEISIEKEKFNKINYNFLIEEPIIEKKKKLVIKKKGGFLEETLLTKENKETIRNEGTEENEKTNESEKINETKANNEVEETEINIETKETNVDKETEENKENEEKEEIKIQEGGKKNIIMENQNFTLEAPENEYIEDSNIKDSGIKESIIKDNGIKDSGIKDTNLLEKNNEFVVKIGKDNIKPRKYNDFMDLGVFLKKDDETTNSTNNIHNKNYNEELNSNLKEIKVIKETHK